MAAARAGSLQALAVQVDRRTGRDQALFGAALVRQTTAAASGSTTATAVVAVSSKSATSGDDERRGGVPVGCGVNGSHRRACWVTVASPLNLLE